MNAQATGTSGQRAGVWVLAVMLGAPLMGWGGEPAQGLLERPRNHLARAKVFLAAGDYRRALEACRQEVEAAPSARSYVYLTYVYHAIDGYLDHLAKTDKWVAVEQLYVNLAGSEPQSLLDPPDVLARIAKEIIQGGVQKQSDVHAAMAARLDAGLTARLWKEQAAWRASKPDSWWSGVPESWGW
jgi:hypothetical protein